jgi:hypothetical protein
MNSICFDGTWSMLLRNSPADLVGGFFASGTATTRQNLGGQQQMADAHRVSWPGMTRLTALKRRGWPVGKFRRVHPFDLDGMQVVLVRMDRK